MIALGSLWTRRGAEGYKRRILPAGYGGTHRTSFQESWLTMNVNFFEWLRDGVRQSVLLGVSDAIEQIGTPAETDKLHPNVAALITGEQPKQKSSRGGGRKRLGKSPKDMETPS